MAENPIRFGILGCAGIARKVSRAIILRHRQPLHRQSLEIRRRKQLPSLRQDLRKLRRRSRRPRRRRRLRPPPHQPPHPVGVALNVSEFDQILKACEANGVQFMDATMWMHNPRTAKMTEFLSDSQIFGQLKTINSCFTFAANPDFLKNDIRVKSDLDALGALGDAGWYCVRSILWIADFELPKTVTALSDPIFNEVEVFLSCGASLHWEDHKVATFHCSFLSNLTMDVTASGTKGTLHIRDLIIPFEEDKASFTVATESGFDELMTTWVPKPSEHTVTTDLPQEACMVREFSRLVAGIKGNGQSPEKKWPTYSRKTQLILDAVKASIEKGFEPVEIVS
ncbi:hypothetical protein HYC85_009174 [Camellia sinensis]|uniref:GFO/IDH/MocA-like oxidoreductase domain-containing protein n=1 Tax=Camellia sinensis TaxID=4442 RepID=A0A7J7HE86_CAMSI|nr:hypothetical protein HYC85_009174 [Camellia sinensis]